MSAYPDTGPPVHARGPDLRASSDPKIHLARYSCLTDITATPKTATWDQLVVELTQHSERDARDGQLWSPVTFKDKASQARQNDNIGTITAFVFDYDHMVPPWGLLDGHRYVAHTTHTHHANDQKCSRPDCPHWRVVVQIAKPIAAADFAVAWPRMVFWLAPDADQSCKDVSRAYYLPSCRPGAAHDTKIGEGQPIDWETLRPIPEPSIKPVRLHSIDGMAVSSERPGERFNREASWDEILEPTGARCIAVAGDGTSRWTRPGKVGGVSATTDGGGQRVLYVFSDSWPPFEPGKSYSRFEAYALLQHNSDRKAAARALAERYGMRGDRSQQAPTVNRPADADTTTDGQPPVRRPLTEMGNAERLVDQHGERIRYCFPWSQWLSHDGKRWERDQRGNVRRWAKQTHRRIYSEAATVENDDQRQAIAKWAARCESSASVAATLKLAEAEEGIPILPEQMDANPYLFNVENGTVDLRTGQLRPHNRQDYITKLARVFFDPDAACPTFLAFLERILPDPDVRAFAQRMAGYAMTGDVSEQCLIFAHGSGANGKSTLLTVLQAMMGDYARQAAPELLVSRGGDRHPTELADLFGARLVTSVEVDDGKRLAEALVKQMTGGDKMKARFMRADFFEWTPTHKLFLAANHRPEIRGTDYAIWRRIHLVPFTVTIPPSERDGKLPSKLLAELPGILNWAIAGCLDWQRNGLGVPQAVREATEEYRAEQDLLADFITDCCVIDAQAYAVSSDLYKIYTAWTEEGGTKPLSKQAFGRRLTERGYSAAKQWLGGQQTRVWRGIGIANDLDHSDRDTIGDRDTTRHDFPGESYPSARESVMPEKLSSSVPEANSVPGIVEEVF
jgi:P4 family phage/plasmid primase-like protien